jgi:hypothetical protein
VSLLAATGPLTRPGFRRFWTAQSISVLGDQVSLLALPLTAVLTLHLNAAEMGLLTAAGYAPHLLLSLLAGSVIDRSSRRRQIMIGADLARALVLASIPLAVELGVLTSAHLYLAAFLAGTFAVFFDQCATSLLVLVTPSEELLAANSQLSTSQAASQVAGPSLQDSWSALRRRQTAGVGTWPSFAICERSFERSSGLRPIASQIRLRSSRVANSIITLPLRLPSCTRTRVSSRSESRSARSTMPGACGTGRARRRTSPSSRLSPISTRRAISSACRTVIPWATIRSASRSCCSGSVSRATALAWPAESVPAAIRSCTLAGRRSRRMALEMAGRLRPMREASSSWVTEKSLRSCA